MPTPLNCAVEFSEADFIGYGDASAHECLVRRTACICSMERICGIDVLPLNAQHVSILTLTGSPFLGGFTAGQLLAKPDILDDVMRFLWIVSPMHKPGAKARAHFWQRKTPRDKFNETFAPIMRETVDKVVSEILEYVKDSFIDSDEPNGPSGPSYFSEEISIAYELSRYHGFRLDFWRPECPPDKNPLLVPLKIVFQLRKVRRYDQHGTDGLSNRSERLIREALPKIGERFKQQQQQN